MMRIIWKRWALAAWLTGMALCAGRTYAESGELTGTLKKISASGVVTLGVRDSSIPFSYLDDQQQYRGYTIDLCMRVVDALQKRPGMPALTVRLNPVTPATRIPLIANGTIDLECGSTTHNPERDKQVAFSVTTFITGNHLLAKKASHIAALADMKGKVVVSTSGSTNLKQMAALNTERNLGMTVLAAEEHAQAFMMVETGRATAFSMDDILLASLAASAKNPSDYTITPEALSVEPYAIMMRRGDLPFKAAVDEALAALYRSGEINAIYSKWFVAPIPPKGINLRFPMSTTLQAVFAHPTDSSDARAYAPDLAAVKPEAK